MAKCKIRAPHGKTLCTPAWGYDKLITNKVL